MYNSCVSPLRILIISDWLELPVSKHLEAVSMKRCLSALFTHCGNCVTQQNLCLSLDPVTGSVSPLLNSPSL